MKHNEYMRKSRIFSLVLTVIVIFLYSAGYVQLPNIHRASSSKNNSLSQNTHPSLPNATSTYAVVRVIDGDTLIASIDGSNVTIRLIGIDTPEVVDPRKPVECFGREASMEAKKVLSGQDVRIELDPSQGNFDKYGRLLAYVYVPANVSPDGILVNKYLIATGYAHEYTYNLPYKYQQEFKDAERDARIHELGLWSPKSCSGDTGVDSSPTTQN
jgi:micrococcal nuclease